MEINFVGQIHRKKCCLDQSHVTHDLRHQQCVCVCVCVCLCVCVCVCVCEYISYLFLFNILPAVLSSNNPSLKYYNKWSFSVESNCLKVRGFYFNPRVQWRYGRHKSNLCRCYSMYYPVMLLYSGQLLYIEKSIREMCFLYNSAIYYFSQEYIIK